MALFNLRSVPYFVALVQFTMAECFFASFIDELPGDIRNNRVKNILFRACCTILFFLVSLPFLTRGGFYVFYLVDVMIGGFPLLIIGLSELFAISYIYGKQNSS